MPISKREIEQIAKRQREAQRLIDSAGQSFAKCAQEIVSAHDAVVGSVGKHLSQIVLAQNMVANTLASRVAELASARDIVGPSAQQLTTARNALARLALPRSFDLARQLVQTHVQWQTSLQLERVIPGLDVLAGVRDAVARALDLTRLVGTDAVAALRAAMRRALPPNWPEDVDVEAAAALIEETGWPLVWLPRASIIESLLNGRSPRARVLVILKRQDQVVEDARERLAEVHDRRLRFLADSAREAADCFEAGHWRASQSLAANILTTLLQVKLGYRKFPDARSALSLKWRQEGIRRLRLALIGPAVAAALADYWVSQGDPVPKSFNRHATVHNVSRTQMSRLNALVSLIVVTAFLRELEQIFREQKAQRAAKARSAAAKKATPTRSKRRGPSRSPK